jgi:putative tryptophan/tyrosine transport system substrate-binding protein
MKKLPTRLLFSFIGGVLAVPMTLAGPSSQTHVPVIGIIVPLKHPAMIEIEQGFRDELKKRYSKPVRIVVKNAEHDPSLQRMIIQQMRSNSTDVIEPIGTSAFEMSLAIVKKKPVIGIAAEFTDQERQSLSPPHASSVLDEVNPGVQLSLIKKMLPQCKTITLVHSADDNTLREVKEAQLAAASLDINLKELTVVTAQDMYTVSHHLSKKSDAVFVLKDNLIVSQMPTLVKQVQSMHIPLIASDDGSVEQGAAMAIGVQERSIGVAAADMTIALLNGESIKDKPVKKLTDYQLFVNSSAMPSQGLSMKAVKRLSLDTGYPIVYLKTHGVS